MKKLCFLSLIMAFMNIPMFGQISLENTYNVTGIDTYGNISYCKLSSGDKYVMINTTSSSISPYETSAVTVNIYNTNHSVYRTINIPFFSLAANCYFSSVYVYNVTDNLFDTDSKVEYVVQYTTQNNVTYKRGEFVRVYNEDGVVKFSKDSARASYAGGTIEGVVGTVGGSPKLFIKNEKSNDKNSEVYSLPGNLLTSLTPAIRKAGDLSLPVPNPSSDVATLEFSLPEGAKTGEIQIYNLKGMLVKKFTVDNTFGNLLLDNSDLEPGTYLYKLQANDVITETQKMLVIR